MYFRGLTSGTIVTGGGLYTSLDVVGAAAASSTFAFGTLGAGTRSRRAPLTHVQFIFSAGTAHGTLFRLHLYSSAPTSITDNGAYTLLAADRAKYLGFVPSAANLVSLGATGYAEAAVGLRKELVLPANTTAIYGVLQMVTGVTLGASESFIINLGFDSQ